MRVTSIVVGMGLLFSSMLAQAEIFADGTGYEGDNYFGVMVASPRFEFDDSGDEFRGTGMFARAGREFFKYAAVEGHFGIFSSDTVDGENYQIEYMASLFGRGNIFLFDDRARAYALAGMTYFAGDVPGWNSVSETSFSYGLGVELYGGSRDAVSLEWIRYADEDIHNQDYTIESVNLGYIHRF
ncbi:MAG: outer membrane beta-barrel protein [Candidatus Thiodiazotropha sp.]